MNKGHNIAILIANGFDEGQLGGIQKTLLANEMGIKKVSPESGVVNGWAENSWGCFFPVDVAVNEALASDYDGLIVMGGDRSIQRLSKTAHTERFVNSFVRVEKPVMTLDSARTLAPEEGHAMLTHVETQQGSIEEQFNQFIENVLSASGDVELEMAA